jgi:hypothetical protein
MQSQQAISRVFNLEIPADFGRRPGLKHDEMLAQCLGHALHFHFHHTGVGSGSGAGRIDGAKQS